ncbi:unnamed protein product, partial [Rotaria sp. Silwood1]
MHPTGVYEARASITNTTNRYLISTCFYKSIYIANMSNISRRNTSKGENSWGGVLMLFKPSLPVVRVKCETPNICIVDVKQERVVRLNGVYAPKSKTWSWNSLSNFITDRCSLFGDFNIDLDDKADEIAAKDLLNWADLVALAPVLPDSPTSLRSTRIIDYAFTRDTPLTIQTCAENTTSDHKPIICVLNCETLIDNNNVIVKDVDAMLDIAATHYENLFAEPQVYRPHPYVDSPEVHWNNRYEPIPPITMPELLKVVSKRVLENRGLLHDSQSGFRSNFRLQSRVLVLIDQISSLMSASAPVATVFIDFKQAFDQLWWTGCL